MLRKKLIFVAAILLVVPLLAVPAQADDDEARQHGDEATLVGCLTQAVAHGDDLSYVPGTWVLTDIENGERILLKGDESLEEHDANHTVEVHGTWVVDPDPELTQSYDDYLKVEKFKHIATTCDAPSNPDEGVG